VQNAKRIKDPKSTQTTPNSIPAESLHEEKVRSFSLIFFVAIDI